MVTDWEMLIQTSGLVSVRVGEVDIRPGDRVRVRPKGLPDEINRALEGKTAIVESIEQDFEHESQIYLAVTIDLAGRGTVARRKPAHRFFFGLEEVEPLPM